MIVKFIQDFFTLKRSLILAGCYLVIHLFILLALQNLYPKLVPDLSLEINQGYKQSFDPMNRGSYCQYDDFWVENNNDWVCLENVILNTHGDTLIRVDTTHIASHLIDSVFSIPGFIKPWVQSQYQSALTVKNFKEHLKTPMEFSWWNHWYNLKEFSLRYLEPYHFHIGQKSNEIWFFEQDGFNLMYQKFYGRNKLRIPICRVAYEYDIGGTTKRIEFNQWNCTQPIYSALTQGVYFSPSKVDP